MSVISELINRRRNQILVHSCLYYRLNENLISDYTFDLWSKELADLQVKHPEIASECVYAEYFKEFNGSTGYDLPYHLPEIIDRANRLLTSSKKRRD